ncbi:hypothetical protein SAMN04487867_1021, partial [Vreelandella titanicae]
TLPQLRFASFAVASLREDLHLQECARAGRTKKASTKLALAIKLRLLVRHVSSFRLLLSSAFQKAPLSLKDIWAIRVRLQLAKKTRELLPSTI